MTGNLPLPLYHLHLITLTSDTGIGTITSTVPITRPTTHFIRSARSPTKRRAKRTDIVPSVQLVLRHMPKHTFTAHSTAIHGETLGMTLSSLVLAFHTCHPILRPLLVKSRNTGTRTHTPARGSGRRARTPHEKMDTGEMVTRRGEAELRAGDDGRGRGMRVWAMPRGM